MPIQNNTTNGVRTRYESEYRKGADSVRLYDQFAGSMKETDITRGTTIVAAALSEMQPRPTAAVASITQDFEPQVIDDVTAQITVDMYNDGLKSHQKVLLTQFSPMAAKFARAVGRNMMETVDHLAARVCTEGDIVLYPAAIASRITLDGATASDGHSLSESIFTTVGTMTELWDGNSLRDGSKISIMDPWAYADLLRNAGGNLIKVQQYTEYGKNMLLNNEIGSLNGFRIIKHALAKCFYGTGAVRTSNYSDTSSLALKPGDKTITPTTNTTNILVGHWMTIGTPQTGASSDATELCETVFVTAKDATTITFVGSGPFGGLRYAHPALTPIINKWHVHPVVFGGPNSIAKAYSKELGEYGELVTPFQTGNAKQWTNWSWKWFGGYGRLAENSLMRGEFASAKA